MNSKTEPMVVYSFMTFKNSFETAQIAPFKATREAVEQRFVGQILEGTAEAVDPGQIDGLGRWARVATGWGELRA